MKLKYHKIRGVDKTVCTVEQRLAYELAFRAYINYNSAWEKLPTATAKHTAVTEIITRQTKILVNAVGLEGCCSIKVAVISVSVVTQKHISLAAVLHDILSHRKVS